MAVAKGLKSPPTTPDHTDCNDPPPSLMTSLVTNCSFVDSLCLWIIKMSGRPTVLSDPNPNRIPNPLPTSTSH